MKKVDNKVEKLDMRERPNLSLLVKLNLTKHI